MRMIDLELAEQAKPVSAEIVSIDRSWRDYIKSRRFASHRLPFGGKYNAVIDSDVILIEGYCGPLLIDRLTGGGNTYLLAKPITYDPFRVYGVWDKSGHFSYFASKPVLGFHYLGLERTGLRAICTGELEYTTPADIVSLQEACSSIVRSFRVIYMGSLGNMFVPEKYARVKEVLGSDTNHQNKISTLLSEGWIKEIL